MDNIKDFACHQPLASKALADFDFSRRLGFDKKL
jgi:hypothetical protein